MDENLEDKLNEYFSEMVIYKEMKNNFFSSLSLPSFLRDWLLKKFEDDDGQFDADEVSEFIKNYIPRKDDWISIKDRIITEHEKVKFLTKITVDIDIRSGEISFALPDFGLSNKETMIEPNVWDVIKDDLVNGKETWGVVELAYRYPEPENRIQGKIKLTDFTNFRPYEIDLDYYKEARSAFTINEWIDILLGAIDYNANGYDNMVQKRTMLTRLLPFVEKRLNLIELAPKGTGKSYLFGRVSKYGWLSSGGVMSRAKMFYDISRGKEGLVAGNDFIALDEVQTISFTDVDEMRAALKGYMESGVYTVGNHEGTADAGIVLLGNISEKNMSVYARMFNELPPAFHESALIDRFHGFIKGWDIPRMHDDLKKNGWALNSEYFCTILHMLRNDVSYRVVVDQLIEVPEHADTRDTEAVKRICTAYLKLLFPNVQRPEDIELREFKQYCLDPAVKMRSIIKYQLALLDDEYKGKDVPKFKLRGV